MTTLLSHVSLFSFLSLNNLLVFFMYVAGLAFCVAFVWACMGSYRQMQAEKSRMKELLGGNFAFVRRNRRALKAKPASVIKVCCAYDQYEEYHLVRGGLKTTTNYESFLLEESGEIIPLEEGFSFETSRVGKVHNSTVPGNAEWLARKWKIPYEMYKKVGSSL